jgi:hypothetical protein
MDLIQALDRRTSRNARGLRLRQFKVVATASSPARVTLEDATGDIANVRYLSSYSPTVNDVVWAIVDEPDILVLGKLA